MRYATRIGLILCVPVVLIAADILGQIGWERRDFENRCWYFITSPESMPYFHVTPAMRAMGAVSRKAAVEGMVAQIKAYYASEAFKSRWAAHVAEVAEREAKRTADDAANQAAGMAHLEQAMKSMSAEDRAAMKQAMEMAKQHQQQAPKSSSQEIKDPKVALKKALQTFLRETEGVDFAAGLRTEGGRKYFISQAYERKSAVWKACFRAGKEPTETARAHAKAWLMELK